MRFRGNAAASRRRGVIALLCVIAIHIALYGWLRSSGGWRIGHDVRAAPALVTLRLLPWLEPAPPKPATDVKAVARARSAFGPISAPTPSLPTRAPTTPTITQAEAPAAPNPPASQASQPPPLRLALPPDYSRRPGLRNPAVDDPRANTARTTPEQRLAGALDTRVIEEDFGDGRRRISQGDKCVIVQPSRIAQLMPFNEAAARTPSLVGACP